MITMNAVSNKMGETKNYYQHIHIFMVGSHIIAHGDPKSDHEMAVCVR